MAHSRKHTIKWLDGLIETENVDADILIISGTDVSQGRDAIGLLEDEGIRAELVKIKCTGRRSTFEKRPSTPLTSSCRTSMSAGGWPERSKLRP